jgi:hypothetical protein
MFSHKITEEIGEQQLVKVEIVKNRTQAEPTQASVEL